MATRKLRSQFQPNQNYKNDNCDQNLESEFGNHATIFNTIEITRQAIDEGMKIDKVAKALVETKNAIDLVLKIRDVAMKTATIEIQENVVELREKLPKQL